MSVPGGMVSLLGATEHFGLGLGKSLSVILASEIGDKTFFIAALMAMRNNRTQVFLGAITALAAMTVLSVVLGVAAPALISKTYTHYAATALFFYFGLRSLYDAFVGGGQGESELDEVEQQLADMHKGKTAGKDTGVESKGDAKSKTAGSLAVMLGMVFTPVFVKTCSLTFLGEWGDRSQIATIGLATSEDPVGVAIGGIVGHSICTGAAVLGGRHLATHINERMVQIAGGVLFVLFGVHALWTGP